ncbi:MAG TPA: peptidoglycan-binding domain-containing protein [Candidatus Binatia bacterium]|nr:peptidoglycan-binding domain-containing protein [Candidatus Binatia bacterium]
MVSAQDSLGGTETGGTLEKPPKREQPSSLGSTPTATSHEIKRAEQALNVQGFNPGRIDGKIDGETKEALREFQKRNNLDVTGDLDKETAEKLGVLLGVDGSSGQQPGKEPPTKEFSPQGKLQ